MRARQFGHQMIGNEQFMNDELPIESRTPGKSQSLDERFADKRHTRQRLFEIADLVDKLVAEG